VRARGHQTDARGEDRTAQLAQLGDGLADARDELDLAAVKLALDLAALELTELLEYLGAGVAQPPAARVDDEQLLLEPERERLLLTEVLPFYIHAPEALPAVASRQPFGLPGGALGELFGTGPK